MPVQKRNYTNSLSSVNSSTGYTEDQLRQQAEREAQYRDFDPRNASINEMVAHAAQVDREREASLARGMNRYAEDPEYITRSIQAFKQVFPYASITDFENFIKSDETLKAYYTATETTAGRKTAGDRTSRTDYLPASS